MPLQAGQHIRSACRFEGDMMDFLEFSRKGYSVRSYSRQPVEDEKIGKILQAAMIAPTAVNYQPQKIYVLKKPGGAAKNTVNYPQHL